MRPVTFCMPSHSEIAERIKSEQSVLKHRLYSCPWTSQTYRSVCRMTMWVMSPQWHARAHLNSPGGLGGAGGGRMVADGGGGGGSGRGADQVCWNHKWLGSRRDGEETALRICQRTRGAAAKQQFSHVSLIKLVDIWKEMEERHREREREKEMKGRERKQQSRGCRHHRTDWCGCHGATRWGWADCNIDSGTFVLPRADLHFDICFFILDVGSFDFFYESKQHFREIWFQAPRLQIPKCGFRHQRLHSF